MFASSTSFFSAALKILNLSMNQLCGVDDMYGNGTYTDVGIKALAEALKVSSALKNVDLVLNCIEGESAQQLVAAALESKTLEVFSTVPIKQLHEECSFCPPASKALGRLNGLFRFGKF